MPDDTILFTQAFAFNGEDEQIRLWVEEIQKPSTTKEQIEAVIAKLMSFYYGTLENGGMYAIEHEYETQREYMFSVCYRALASLPGDTGEENNTRATDALEAAIQRREPYALYAQAVAFEGKDEPLNKIPPRPNQRRSLEFYIKSAHAGCTFAIQKIKELGIEEFVQSWYKLRVAIGELGDTDLDLPNYCDFNQDVWELCFKKLCSGPRCSLDEDDPDEQDLQIYKEECDVDRYVITKTGNIWYFDHKKKTLQKLTLTGKPLSELVTSFFINEKYTYVRLSDEDIKKITLYTTDHKPQILSAAESVANSFKSIYAEILILATEEKNTKYKYKEAWYWLTLISSICTKVFEPLGFAPEFTKIVKEILPKATELNSDEAVLETILPIIQEQDIEEKSNLEKLKLDLETAKNTKNKSSLEKLLPLVSSNPLSTKIIESLNKFAKAIKHRPEIMEDFLQDAVKICDEQIIQETQENYNTRVCIKLSKLAKEKFTHRRHAILRALVDLVFIPIGFATFGIAFGVKYYLTESPTFFVGKSKTRSHKKLDDFLEEVTTLTN